jgi:hypothetical protein
MARGTEDDEPTGCTGREQRHDRSPIPCFKWSLAGGDDYGVL